MGDLQKVLQNLLRERVPVRDLVSILESLGDAAEHRGDLVDEVLGVHVRRRLVGQEPQHEPHPLKCLGLRHPAPMRGDRPGARR